MSSLTFPCLDPSSPAPPPSPMQPICTSLFSTCPSNPSSSSRFRKKTKSTTSQTKQSEMTDDGLEEFYQTYDGADWRRIHEYPGNPYSQGVTAWRLWQDWWEKKGVTMMMKKRKPTDWIEKYRPRSIEEFICHREIALGLRQQNTKSTTSQTKQLEMTVVGLEEFYQTYDGADWRRIHEYPGNPYSQGVTAWRLWQDWWEKKGVTMMMKKRESIDWIEKYRPRSIEEFICHREIALGLRQQVARGVDSHFIFEGPPGVGKKTMVGAFLREAFGPDTLETREELKEFELKGEEKAKIELHVTLSPQHVEIDLSKIEGYEKHVIPALVEETDSMATKAIVLYQADQLCMDTQDYICWIMKKHKNCHKFLFCCSDVSNLQSIRAMCAMIQLLPPSNDEIFSVLEHIAEKEGIEMPQDVALTIAKDSTCNLQQAIRLFESSSLAKHNSHQTISV